MVAVISFLAILFLSLTVVRTATVMLRLTGLSRDIAQFQARSAFTTTGFTVQESEAIMTHPVRRKIIQNLMLLGNIGFVSFISSLLLTFVPGNKSENILLRIGLIAGGSLAIFLLTRIPLFDKAVSWFVQRTIGKNTRLYRKDYDSLLFLAKDYEIVKMQARIGSWLCDRPLKDLRLSEEGVLVIGVRRSDGYFIGSPRGDTVLYAGDEVILYGREELLIQIFERPLGTEGDEAHRENVERQRKREGRGPSDEKGAVGIVRKAVRSVRKNRR